MPTFQKIIKEGYTVYFSVNKGKRLVVIPATEEKHGQESMSGDEEFLREYFSKIYKGDEIIDINETEFRQAVGDIQGDIKNFMDFLNIE